MPLPSMGCHLNTIIGELGQDETMDAIEEVIRFQSARFSQSPALVASVLTRRMIRAVPEPEPEDGAA